MKTTIVAFLFLCFCAITAHADTYVVLLDGTRASYATVTYQRTECDGQVTHSLSCAGDGSNSCCWPFIVAPSALDCVAEYSDIFDYIMNEIVNNNQSSGQETWGACNIPISWSVNQEGAITIEIDSDSPQE
jgi:hypothetical protein